MIGHLGAGKGVLAQAVGQKAWLEVYQCRRSRLRGNDKKGAGITKLPA